MTFIYELDPYPVEIYSMRKNELPTSRLSKVIVWQTYRHRRMKLYTTPHRRWSTTLSSAARCSMNNVAWWCTVKQPKLPRPYSREMTFTLIIVYRLLNDNDRTSFTRQQIWYCAIHWCVEASLQLFMDLIVKRCADNLSFALYKRFQRARCVRYAYDRCTWAQRGYFHRGRLRQGRGHANHEVD